MLSVALGKRYERLLFFTAPISLAAIVVFVVAFASTRQQAGIDAKCYDLVAEAITRNKERLDSAWAFTKRPKATKLSEIAYSLDLQSIWIVATIDSKCYSIGQTLLDEAKSPSNLIQEVKQQSTLLRKKPLEMYGIVLPSKTSVELLGTKIEIELLTFTRILQAVLFPVILMWLGSLYSTRFRETLMTHSSGSLADVFPHVINMYPHGPLPNPRKRNRLAPHYQFVVSLLFAIVRLGLLSIFILPPVFAYVASLYLMSDEARLIAPYAAAGVLVLIFAFTTLVAEVLPQHMWKWYSDPEVG